MVRGGKFKQKRGGGRNFSKDMSFDNGDRTRHTREEEDDDSSDEESNEIKEEEEDDDDDDDGESSDEGEDKPDLTRTERREQKKKEAAEKLKKNEGDEEEDPDLINPNHVKKSLNIADLNEPRTLTRREREQKEKQDAKDRYWKLHVQGKTDEAKADLQRLAKVRAEREAALAKRKAEAEAKAQEAEAKKQAQLAASSKKAA